MLIELLRARLRFVAVLSVALSTAHPALAQELPPEDDFGDFEIETEEQASAESDFLKDLRKSLSVTVGTMAASGEAFDRTMSGLNVGVDTSLFSGFKFIAQGGVSSYESTFKQELARPNDPYYFDDEDDIPDGLTPTQQTVGFLCSNDQDTFVIDPQGSCPPGFTSSPLTTDVYQRGDVFEPRREVKLDGSNTVLNEAFFQWDMTSFMTVRAGRQRLVWGQFNLFSPATIAMPYASSGTSVRSTKADLIYPQDIVSVSIFPLDNLEVSLFQSAGIRLDQQTEDAQRRYAALDAEFYADYYYADDLDVNDAFQDPADVSFSAARIMLYSSAFTAGLTIVDGYDAAFTDPQRDLKLEATGETAEFNEQNYDVYEITEDNGVSYTESQMISAEISIPVTSKFTFKAEASNFNTLDNISLPGNRLSTDAEALFEKIVSPARGEDQGKLVKDQTVTVVAVGGEYVGEKWLASLQLVNLQQNDDDAEFQVLEDAAQESFFEDDEIDTIPLVTIVRQLGADNQGYLGFGMGAFFQSFGGGFFAGWTFFESFEVGGFYGMTEGVEGAPEDDEFYDNPTDGAVAQFGVNYRF